MRAGVTFVIARASQPHTVRATASLGDRCGDAVQPDFIYFGVDCRSCDVRIPVVEVISAPHIYSWRLPPIDNFLVDCPVCGTSARYRQRELVMVLLHAPAENFVTNAQFERLCF